MANQDLVLAAEGERRGGGKKAVNQEGAWAQEAEAKLPSKRHDEEVERGLAHGLEAGAAAFDGMTPAHQTGYSSGRATRGLRRKVGYCFVAAANMPCNSLEFGLGLILRAIIMSDGRTFSPK
jgi:hypothetical protein